MLKCRVLKLAATATLAAVVQSNAMAGAVTHANIGSWDCGYRWPWGYEYSLNTVAQPGDTTHSMTNFNGQWRGGYWAHWSNQLYKTTGSGTQGSHNIYASAYSYFTSVNNFCS